MLMHLKKEGEDGYSFFSSEVCISLQTNPTCTNISKVLLYAMLLLHYLHSINISPHHTEQKTKKMNSSTITQKPYKNFDK